MAGRVTVYGSNIVRPPLCDDPDARMVVIRNVEGDPIVLLVRIRDDIWGLSTPSDKDWEESCIRVGLMPGRSFKDVVDLGKSNH